MKDITEKQKAAIMNMSRALGISFSDINLDLNISEASEKISKLKDAIETNISICGCINPRRTIDNYELDDQEDADFGSAFGLDW